MRPALISTLLLTVAAGGCFSGGPVTLTLRPAGEVGTQIIKTSSGPGGEPTLDIIAGPSASTVILSNHQIQLWQQQSPPAGDITREVPKELWRDFVVRGKIKYVGPAGPGGVLLELSSGVWTGLAAYDLVELFGSGDTGWHDIELTYHGEPGNFGFGGNAILLNLRLKLAANAGKVTLAEPFVVTRLVKSDDQWEEKEQLTKLAWKLPQWIYPHANSTEGPAGEPALNLSSLAPCAYTLAVSDQPRISSTVYALRGRVRCDHYTQGDYLELLSDFGDAGIISTRRPLELLPNTEDQKEWRGFELSVQCPAGMTPRRLTLKAFLQSGGAATVCQPLTVAPLTLPSAWWTATQGGWIGGSWALLLVTLGSLASLSAALDKPLRTASLCGAGLGISGLAIVVGLIALCAAQPTHVIFPLILIGGIGVWVFTFHLRGLARRSQADELRRMTAADVV
jgi:hypothetical protein